MGLAFVGTGTPVTKSCMHDMIHRQGADMSLPDLHIVIHHRQRLLIAIVPPEAPWNMDLCRTPVGGSHTALPTARSYHETEALGFVREVENGIVEMMEKRVLDGIAGT